MEEFVLPKRFEQVRLSNHEVFLLINCLHHHEEHMPQIPECVQPRTKILQLCKYLEQYIKPDLEYLTEERKKHPQIGQQQIIDILYKPDF